MTLFDAYVVVDWSARSTPATGRDSIWIAVLDRDGEPTLSNPPTRALAEVEIVSSIAAQARTLLAIDVALGYPAGTARHFGVGDGWRAMWAAIATGLHDDDRNRNDRFALAATLNRAGGGGPGPFWGRPAGHALAGLDATKPAEQLLPELRRCELAARRQGRRPSSVWQLLGAGSVGGQTLTALPMLSRLVDGSPDRVGVWPFSTGLRCPDPGPGDVVVAEVWPSWFVDDAPNGVVRDAHQVAEVARLAHAADQAGELARWFEPDVADHDVGDVVGEEGWVLGVPA